RLRLSTAGAFILRNHQGQLLMVERSEDATMRCRPRRVQRARTVTVAVVLGVAWVATATAQVRRGDCNDDGAVTVDELITGVNIALASLPLSTCPQFDGNDDGRVTI